LMASTSLLLSLLIGHCFSLLGQPCVVAPPQQHHHH
jgi:hypothetical protein